MDVVTLGLAKADARRRYRPRLVSQPLLRPVTWRANHLGGSTYLATAGKEHATFRVQHRLIQGVRATGIRLLYTNWFGVSDLSIQAHLEVQGKGYPATFGGVRTGTCAINGFLLSDPLPVTLDEADSIVCYSSTYVDAGVGGRIPIGIITRSANGEGNNLADATAGGASLVVTAPVTTPTNPTGTNAGAYGPSAVLGVPDNPNLPAVLGVGDSIMVGAGDVGPAWASAAPTGDFGFLLRALQNNNGPTLPYLLSAKFGETGSAASTQKHMRGLIADYCTDVVEEYGTNDVNTPATASQIEGYRSAMWRTYSARGKRVWACTIVPRSSSTNLWTTTAGQTAHTNDAARVAVNDWLRAGAPLDPTTYAPVAVGTGGALVIGNAKHPLAGYFEVADTVESARNSGLWKAALRSVSDAAATNGSATVTSATAAFTSADLGRTVVVTGAGPAGGFLQTTIATVNSATSVTLGGNASTTVSGTTLAIGTYSGDGIHPTPLGHAAMAAAIDTAKFTI